MIEKSHWNSWRMIPQAYSTFARPVSIAVMLSPT